MRKRGLMFAACLALAASAAAQMETPQPGPEHKKLDLFAGNWTVEGEMKPVAGGNGGRFSENERCEWMDGNFFVVCKADFKSSMGTASGVSFMGYSPDDKSYTYREFNSMGEFMESKGSVEGDTWTWIGDEKMGPKTWKGKFTMKLTNPTSYTFTVEMSEDGTKWTTVMDGKATKAK